MDVVSVWTVVDLKSQYLRRAPQERSVAEEAARDRKRRLRWWKSVPLLFWKIREL